ncbi:ATP-dependent RNA helicase SUPV3L1/SUV3 [Aliiruegeria haliotis]|uniref:ATP-dependent RNA helicase SUPV3L1/SUV3 n=1 Tax=Aliiruegeria haliotis TaxID=1280846 RepID=A0A2T0RUW4_9RHOB|nr:helicase-related protein [Aliiruegeria haliotis]PRY24985.1 ATP-dependent RNA helicase SUPV3L1/SUV3 [Aliiruegeria haliotis]
MLKNTTVTAVLGPTNTGKTHYAIERMLAHRTGVIGLPLRLLAREVYDRIVALRGPNVVALLTGEERIVPERAAYWVCTVEAMPVEIGADFLAIDEIQLCADPERGHVFTDRLLHARGLHETMFLGADTMRGAIAAIVPKVQFMRRERFSELTYGGSKKISRMPPRSAIVGFSVDNVYAIAELLRRQKGGAAVVMGALSPRTRNAQVELYQNGDVDHLVATDAIGMGLNLDITHVAFSGLRKFDGRRMRELAPNELAQIAGRAGRYKTHGSFGVTGEAPALDDEVVEAITNHHFTPIRKLQWRNSDLEFGSVDRLVGSLEVRTDDEWLTRTRESDDLMALKALAGMPEVMTRIRNPRSVMLLWDVCRIPDFRGISHAEHASLLERIFAYLHEFGRVPDDWLARQVKRIDRTQGDIDTLSKRLAYIRTWTYVAQRSGWVDDETHWRGETRAVEDRLSDALHGALTQRFVDRRTSVLMRRLKQKESLVAEVNDKGEVTVAEQFVGRLEGFRFSQDPTATPEEAKMLRQAAMTALRPEFHLRADRFYNSPDTELDFTEQGGLMWGEHAVGKLVKGGEAFKPTVVAFVDEEAGHDVTEKVTRRLQHFIDRKVATLFEPLLGMSKDETLTGLPRGFAFQLLEAFGVLSRDSVAADVKALDQDARGQLRKHGVRFGQYTIFMPLLLKPAPTRLRLVLWSLWNDLDTFPEAPPPGLVTVPVPADTPQEHAAMSGYRIAGARAIRIDMLERLADQLRSQDSRGGFEALPDMLSITGMTLEQFADLMQGLGYRAEKAERPKVKAAPAEAEPEAQSDNAEADAAAPEDAAPTDGDAVAAAPVEEAGEEAPEFAASETANETAQPDAGAPAEDTPTAVEGAAEVPPAVGQDTEAPVAEPSEAEAEAGTQAESDADAGEPDVASEPSEPAEPEVEVFYTFTWAPRRQGGGRPRREQGRGDRPERQGDKPRVKGKRPPKGEGGKGPRGKGGKPQGGKTYQARPPRKEKPIDPDNPFAAALMGLTEKK